MHNAFVRDRFGNPQPPLPSYARSLRAPFRRRYICECGRVFKRESDYRLHWIEVIWLQGMR